PEYSVSPSVPHGIAAGPDNNIWFTDNNAPASIGRIATDGSALTKFTTGLTSTSPWRITAGPDGALWFVDHTSNGGKYGRVTTSGAITEYSGATGIPQDIVAGPDGNPWIAEGANPGKIGRITT